MALVLFKSLLTSALLVTMMSSRANNSPLGSHILANSVSVDISHRGAAINPDMWGVFFEDINFGADGGLNAELIKNRSFEFPDPLMGWHVLPMGSGKTSNTNLKILTEQPANPTNPHYLHLSGENNPGIENEGFRGIGLKKQETYIFRAFVRVPGKTSPKALQIELVSPQETIVGRATVSNFRSDWALYTVMFKATATESRAKFRMHCIGQGSIDIDMISLYPEKTWKNRPFGLRADLVQKLAEMKPGFLRFPGGCIVEGQNLNSRYQWKKTIGPAEGRETQINRWNDVFRHKPTPDYFQSFGLGFFEYFQLSEDIGSQPLPILNCGMACQFQSKELVPLNQLDPYVQDALDLIEFANGAEDSEWGSKRATMGHPKPFYMKYLGIGNEQWGKEYFPRYEMFAKAIKDKHPEIVLVTSAGPSPDNDDFKYAWKMLKSLPSKLVDIVDEHVYAAPSWFFDNAHRYDKYDRTGPKVFMGEYAAQSVAIASPDNKNDWQCALSEAAFMTGLERNADVVRMASYAPLFAHVDAWQWTPNLIWFDNSRSYATPNYYVQQLFSLNRGDYLLPTSLNAGMSESGAKSWFYTNTVYDAKSSEIILKIVNGNNLATFLKVSLVGQLSPADNAVKATVTVLTSPQLTAENSFEHPTQVSPTTSFQNLKRDQMEFNIPSNSFVVIRLKVPKIF